MNIIIILSLFFSSNFASVERSESVVVTDPITWPLDFSICVSDTVGLAALIHPSNLVSPFNRPIVSGPCANNYWISWSDQIFVFDELEYCYKILRTWTVISSCFGTQVHVQKIKVIVKKGPIIPCDAP
jgi:hypothetical protein